MHNKVTIEEPEERSEGPEWEVGGVYECVSGLFKGAAYVATPGDDLIGFHSGKPWDPGTRFAGHEYRFRRLPPGTKVTITVGGEEP